MKTLAYFPDYAAMNATPVLAAFLESAKKHYTIVKDSLDADVAVIWSCLWAGKMRNNQDIYKHYRSLNKPVIIIEVGALQRNVTWKISVNHITADGYYGHQQNLDWERPRKLGLPELKPQRAYNQNESILICLQHSKSQQVSELHGIEQWLLEEIKSIEQYTDRNIVIRPHPRSTFNRNMFLEYDFDYPGKIHGSYDDFNLQFNYWAMVNYNSAGPAIQSLIAGCPVIVDRSSLAWPCSISVAELDKPIIPDRSQWYVEIAHTEYTVDEIKQGLWYERLQWAIE